MTAFLISTLLILTGAAAQSAAGAGEPLVSEIVVNAPVEDVWSAFATRDGMRAWHTGNMSEIDLAIGSTWRSSYNPESNLDDDTVIETRLLAFDPGRMMAAQTVGAPADFPVPNAIFDTWYVLYLEPMGEAQTRVIHRMFGFTDSEESQAMREFFEWGNPYELRELAEHFK